MGAAESRGVHHASQGQRVKCGRGEDGRAKEARIHTSCRFFPKMRPRFQRFVVGREVGKGRKLEAQGQKDGTTRGVRVF